MRRDRTENLSWLRKGSIMTTCEAVATVLGRYGGWRREYLPGWLRDPVDEEQFDLAFAVAASPYGIEPVCEDGILVGWSGLGFRARKTPANSGRWNLN